MINVHDFGALGDGVADDTAAVQAALNSAIAARGGVVYFPAGKYKITSTLMVGTDTQTSSISIQGDGPLLTTLLWQGGAVPCLQINRNKYYKLSGFAIQGGAIVPGSKGIYVASGTTTASGTLTNGAIWEHLMVGGFDIGIHAGQGNVYHAASEHLCQHIVVNSCNTGILLEDYNTLNWQWNMLEIGGCNIGMRATSGASIAVHGGSTGGNSQYDFLFGAGGHYSLTGVRTEASTVAIQCSGTCADTCLTITDCEFIGSKPGNNLVCGHGGCNLTVIGSRVFGRVYFDGAFCNSGRLNLFGNSIQDTQLFHAPNASIPYSAFGNKQVDPGGMILGYFPDECGHAKPDGTLSPTWRATADGKFGLFGATAAQPVLATGAGHTVDDVIGLLQSFGWARQA